MSTLKILIVEDEELIVESLSSTLKKLEYEVIGTADTCEKAILIVKESSPDLIFLDIDIFGDKDGIETAQLINDIGDFPVIFLTNYQDLETIKRAEKTNPADYLVKPFNEYQLHVSIQRAIFNYSKNRKAIAGEELSKDIPEQLPKGNIFFLKDTKGNYKKYNISEILFIRAGRAYCDIFISNGETITQSIPMTKTWNNFNHENLVQVHRSYVVNVEAIKGVKGNILLIGDHSIPISLPFKDAIFKYLNFV